MMAEKSKGEANSSTSPTGPPSFPLSRIRTIMKSAPDIENIGQESVFVVEKASELLVSYLINEAYKRSKGKNVTYKDLATVINSEERLEFLRDIIPHKIKLGDYLNILAKVEMEEEEQANIF